MEKIIAIFAIFCHFQHLQARPAESVNLAQPTKIHFRGPMNDRQLEVVKAFNHSWEGYKKYAWGHDTLKPISKSYEDWFNIGLTILDSLDTMYIMNLQEDFQEAKNWVENDWNMDNARLISLFEVTIRGLGGLLGAYHLSGEEVFLRKATELANKLLPQFDTASGIPSVGDLAEIATLQLEFRDLSLSTGNKVYDEKVTRISEFLHNHEKINGLLPNRLISHIPKLSSDSRITIGASADSYYEYLLKQWLQSDKQGHEYLINDYKLAIDGILSRLVGKTRNNLTYIGDLYHGNFAGTMDHLTCFLPGTLLLGHENGMHDSHLELANKLMETCYQMYAKQPTFLAPERVHFGNDMYVSSEASYNILRPEFIESLYYFYSITGNITYQDMGWRIFEAFNQYTRVENGYSSINNVQDPENVGHSDKMESFWIAETLKYFYLLFSDDRNEIDLDKFVFNTEAHLLPVRH